MRFGLWRRPSVEPDENTGQRRLELADAEARLQRIEARAGAATHAILERHARNHWTEAVQAVMREAR